jgi:hypothetical protein
MPTMSAEAGVAVLITLVSNIRDQREYEATTEVSPPAQSVERFLVSTEQETKPVAETRNARDRQSGTHDLRRPPLLQEPLFTTLPSIESVKEFLRAMEEARAKGKSRIDTFE